MTDEQLDAWIEYGLAYKKWLETLKEYPNSSSLRKAHAEMLEVHMKWVGTLEEESKDD